MLTELWSSHISPSESDDDFEPPQSYLEGMNLRRKSVFGESYEPDSQESSEERVRPPKPV